MIKPLELINSLRKTDGYIEAIFMQGGCYQFHLFLNKIYTDSKPFINKELNHVVTKIGDRFYDITGEVVAEYIPLTKEHLPLVEKWSFAGNMLLQIKECPFCEEPICT